jgi:hypothetical protein
MQGIKALAIVIVALVVVGLVGMYITGVPISGQLAPVGYPLRVASDSLIDPRSYWVQVVDPTSSTTPYWDLVGYAYQDETQSGGNHNVYVTVIDEHGAPLSGVSVWLKWPDAQGNESQQFTLTGATNYGLYGGPFYPDQGQCGPYTVYVVSPSISTQARCLGLPANRHVNYLLTYQRVLGTPTVTPTIVAVPTRTPTPTPIPSWTVVPGVYLTPRDLSNWLRKWADELETGAP